jgi:fructose-1,6-bisphosphatase/inositol monophosphatase family enzyme
MVTYLEAKGTAAEASLDLGIETKSGSADFCTKVDVENEKLVIEGIQKRFPNHGIIGEESVGVGSIPDLNPNVPTWIIDPIDGTTNFSSGLHSLTCVSIGYCVDGRPVMGVVYAPGTNELYVGVKGCGAYRNGQPIFQNPKQSTKAVSEAVICNEMGYTRNQKDMDILMGAQARVMLKGCRAMRQLGSGCLDLCFVASGRLDVVYAGLCDEGWKPWDYAASLVICQEAGCTMETIEPQETSGCDGFDLYGKSVICGVSEELVGELRSVLLDR